MKAYHSGFNQFTSGILYFFQSPVRDYFQWKAINNFFLNETKSGQPNKCLFSLTFRELNGYFLLLRSSFLQLDRWQAPTQRPIIDQRPVRDQRQWIYICLYKFLAGTSKEQVLGKNPQKSELVHCLQYLFVRGHQTVTPWTPRNDCVFTSQAPRWLAMRGVLPKHNKIV